MDASAQTRPRDLKLKAALVGSVILLTGLAVGLASATRKLESVQSERDQIVLRLYREVQSSEELRTQIDLLKAYKQQETPSTADRSATAANARLGERALRPARAAAPRALPKPKDVLQEALSEEDHLIASTLQAVSATLPKNKQLHLSNKGRP